MRARILAVLAIVALAFGIGTAPAWAYVTTIGVNDYATQTVNGVINNYTISSWHNYETTNSLKSPKEFRVTKTDGQCSITKVVMADSRFTGYYQITYGTPVGSTGIVPFPSSWGSPWYTTYHIYWTVYTSCDTFVTATTDIA